MPTRPAAVAIGAANGPALSSRTRSKPSRERRDARDGKALAERHEVLLVVALPDRTVRRHEEHRVVERRAVGSRRRARPAGEQLDAGRGQHVRDRRAIRGLALEEERETVLGPDDEGRRRVAPQ
jgi:hypothetical protein